MDDKKSYRVTFNPLIFVPGVKNRLHFLIRESKNDEVWNRNVDKLICKCTWKHHFFDGL